MKKPSTSTLDNPGLINPQVIEANRAETPGSSPTEHVTFHTKIAEPRWQQIVSAIGAGVLILLWLWMLISHR